MAELPDPPAMKMPSPRQVAPGDGSRETRAFTLVELIVVMGIIIILIAFAVPAVGPVLRGSQLTQSANVLVDQLNLARQQAMALSNQVEVRFYQFGDASLPGQTVANPSSGKFRAIQSYVIQASGAKVPLGKVQNLPGTVIFDSGTNGLSTILSGASASLKSTGTVLNVPLPRVDNNYNCVFFHYLPDGSTDLPQTSTVQCLTLHGLEAGDQLSTPPPNFFTVQISPNNGHIRSFRP